MTFLARMDKAGSYSVINSEGDVYIHNLSHERAMQIAAAWNAQNYKGIDE